MGLSRYQWGPISDPPEASRDQLNVKSYADHGGSLYANAVLARRDLSEKTQSLVRAGVRAAPMAPS